MINIDEMERKTARITVLVEPGKKKAFEQLSRAQDMTASQVMRMLLREFMAKHSSTQRVSKRVPRMPKGPKRA